jgi:hypothetical protein
MNQDISIAVALIVITSFFLIVQLYKNHKLEEDIEMYKRSNRYLEDRIAKRDIEGERNFKDLVGGIDGVTSVSLSAKRYVELLRAENDLVDLKVKVRELDNE